MNAKKLNQILIASMVLGVVGLAYGYNYSLKRIDKDRFQVAALNAKIEAIDEKLTLTIATENQLEQLGFIQDIAKEVIPDEKTQPELIAQLLQISSENSVSISSIQFASQTVDTTAGAKLPDVTQAEPLKGVPGVYTLPITISISGRYDRILETIRDVENNRRKIQIRSVNIKPILTQAGSPTSEVNASVVLDVYVRP